MSTTLEGGNTLVIAGSCRPHEALAARRLAERLACPFLADITTGLRGLAYDLQLIRPDHPPPETVIHVGGRIVSKRWWQWLDQHAPRELLQLVLRGQAIDPIHRVTQVLQGPLVGLCDQLVAERPSQPGVSRPVAAEFRAGLRGRPARRECGRRHQRAWRRPAVGDLAARRTRLVPG